MEGRLNERCKPPGWPVTDECVQFHDVGLPCSHFKKTESELQGTEVVKKKERKKERKGKRVEGRARTVDPRRARLRHPGSKTLQFL